MSKFRRPKLRGKKRKVSSARALHLHNVSTEFTNLYRDIWAVTKGEDAKVQSAPKRRRRLLRSTVYRRAFAMVPEPPVVSFTQMPSSFDGIKQGEVYDPTKGGTNNA